MFSPVLLLGAAALLVANVQGASYCDDFPVDVLKTCELEIPRDIIFVADGSASMNPDNFYNELLDFTLVLVCAFQEELPNRMGMVLFNIKVEPIIPIAQYTRAQWKERVEAVRDTRDAGFPRLDNGTGDQACCSCCTPTADALVVASEEFARLQKPNDVQMAFVITDGVPSNNNENTGGDPANWFFDKARGLDPAVYATVQVPAAAQVLKDTGVRVMLVGVPNFKGSPPDQAYFDGTSTGNGRNYCPPDRRGDTFCAPYFTNPESTDGAVFPIVSRPVASNSFVSNNFDVKQLICDTVEFICEPPPTFQPTQNPTPAPTSLTIEQVDLTFLVDRSNSMNYYPEFCDEVLDTFPPRNTGSTAPCWELWVRYMTQQAMVLTNIPAGEQGVRQLGWRADFPGDNTPAKGLRVHVVGFACANNQRSPKVFKFSDEINGGPIVSEEQLVSFMEVMRTTVFPDGGTCPGLATEEVVKWIETTDEKRYPLHTVILLTDGVFFDGSAAAKASRGITAYKGLRYAVGIAISNKQSKFGLSPQEQKIQEKQLSSFVGQNEEYFFNLKEGFTQLLAVAESIAVSLPRQFFAVGGSPMERYNWCGFRRKFNCLSQNSRDRHCKWIGGKRDQYKCRRA